MSYRKFRADYLFDGYELRDAGNVLVCSADGSIESIIPPEQAGDDLEEFRGLITPGFINCHCHLELSHLKGKIPEKQGLVDFLLSVISQRNQPDEIRQEAIRREESYMLGKGIIAVGDICNTADTLFEKSKHRLFYYNFLELLGWDPQQAWSRYQAGKALAARFLEGLPGDDHFSISPHAPYTISDELWQLMDPDFQGKTVSIHNQESEAENDFFKTGHGALTRIYTELKIQNRHFIAGGTRSLPHYLGKMNSASQILLVHNTFTDESDLDFAVQFSKNPGFCLCPNANLYIEGRLPDIPIFMNRGVGLVLGTDSLASNHQLCIVEEIKSIKRSFPKIPTREMLVWATSNGAKMLRFSDHLGDFSKGKKPGVVLIENLVAGEISEKSTSRRIL